MVGEISSSDEANISLNWAVPSVQCAQCPVPSAQRAHCVVQFGAFEVHCCCLLVQYMGRGLDSLQHSVLHWIAKELCLDRKARDCSNIQCHISGQPGPSTQIWKSKRGFHRPVLAGFKTFKLVAKMFQRTVALLCFAVN